MVMERLGNVDAVKSARFSSRGYASFAGLFASRFRSTTPIDRVLSFVVLRIEKAVVRQKRFSSLTFHEFELLIFQDFSLRLTREFGIEEICN